ncbi:class I SAM-dependent methyltransferase [Herbiconiux moechotypicola]|uniref:Class I SAM-dependent methyltransferase n=1 Tax=Herbiconiux moechotypicola TaxID=637393 RepID=A0ABN3D914_9MICO|nr:class I SAM-dependent methyltransferase [Herbiconiux moechotypicola]MCS5728257.1 class I SAM-dependent methyltransferase [Herbiconiux moechotypicola]
MKDRRLAQSFGAEAAAYEQGRPGYPADAVQWILAATSPDELAPAHGQGSNHPGAAGRVEVVDLGAGTGKFTRALVSEGAEVTAVEPDPQMRERLAVALPEVTTLAGTAESIPLGAASADLVTMAQAWHWVDPVAASAEIARVLRPGGVLALVWNVRDHRVPWVQALTEVIGASIAEEFDTVHPPLGDPLVRDAFAEFDWRFPLDRDGMHALVASRSSVIALDPPARHELADRLDKLLDAHPALAGRTGYELPYRTRVTLARRP